MRTPRDARSTHRHGQSEVAHRQDVALSIDLRTSSSGLYKGRQSPPAYAVQPTYSSQVTRGFTARRWRDKLMQHLIHQNLRVFMLGNTGAEKQPKQWCTPCTLPVVSRSVYHSDIFDFYGYGATSNIISANGSKKSTHFTVGPATVVAKIRCSGISAKVYSDHVTMLLQFHRTYHRRTAPLFVWPEASRLWKMCVCA